MRTMLFALALGLVSLCLTANTSHAAVGQNDGQIPASTLSSMGLGGMVPMSDAQGMQVRGKLLQLQIIDVDAGRGSHVSVHATQKINVKVIIIGGGGGGY